MAAFNVGARSSGAVVKTTWAPSFTASSSSRVASSGVSALK